MSAPAKTKREYLLEFDEASHTYFVDGEIKLSTTQVLKLSGVVDDRWYDEECRWRGSQVHLATAAEDAGGIAKCEPEYLPYVQAWRLFKKEKRFRPTLIEHRLYDPLLDTCGTLDRVGIFDAGAADVLIDLKTSKSGQIPRWVALQTASYGHALNPAAVWRRMAVILLPDGSYKVEPYAVDDYTRHVSEFATLARAVQVRREYGN